MPAYKNEKRGTWYVSFHYKDCDGTARRKKKEGFKTKREALDWERDFLKAKAGTTDMTLGALYSLYIADCETRLRQTTLEKKRWSFEQKILPSFRDVQIRDITPTMIRLWQNGLLSFRDKNGNGYSKTYLREVNSQFSAIMNYAVRFYGLPTNPVTLCGPFGKKNADTMQFWTRDEFRLAIAQVKKPAYKLAFELLFWTGMRSGELLALTLQDVDFEKGTISITKSVGLVRGGTIINPPKTPKSNRVIPVPKFLLAMIKDYTDRLVDYQPEDAIFNVKKNSLGIELNKAANAAGVKRIRVHDLRHSHASLLIEMGYAPLVISERLGHENIQTTLQIYSHLYPNKQEEIVSELEDIEGENYGAELSDFEKKAAKTE